MEASSPQRQEHLASEVSVCLCQMPYRVISVSLQSLGIYRNQMCEYKLTSRGKHFHPRHHHEIYSPGADRQQALIHT